MARGVDCQTVCAPLLVILKHSTACRGILSAIHQRLNDNYGSLVVSQPTQPLPLSSVFRMVRVNQSLINPNGVNECQSECESFPPVLINMTYHIHIANHWHHYSEHARKQTHTHRHTLDVDLPVEGHNTWCLDKWQPDNTSGTRTLQGVNDWRLTRLSYDLQLTNNFQLNEFPPLTATTGL